MADDPDEPDNGINTPVNLAAIDVVLIAAYFLMVGVVGLAFWIKERRSASAPGGGSSEEFFLAGRSMGWPAIGLSLFVSNIGSEHLVGLAGSAAASGLAVGLYEWSAGIHILVLGFLMAPIYLQARIATLPEYLERRYNKRLRSMLSVVSLAIYIFTKLSVSVYSGATVLHTVFGWPVQLAAVGLVGLTAAYTALGGLAAVIVTDVAQSAVLLLGAFSMTAAGLEHVGGMAGLMAEPPPGFVLNATDGGGAAGVVAVNCSALDEAVARAAAHCLSHVEWRRFFRLYRPLDDPDFPFVGMIIGQNVGGLWYWCLDQAIVQRVLSARSEAHGAPACGSNPGRADPRGPSAAPRVVWPRLTRRRLAEQRAPRPSSPAT